MQWKFYGKKRIFYSRFRYQSLGVGVGVDSIRVITTKLKILSFGLEFRIKRHKNKSAWEKMICSSFHLKMRKVCNFGLGRENRSLCVFGKPLKSCSPERGRKSWHLH